MIKPERHIRTCSEKTFFKYGRILILIMAGMAVMSNCTMAREPVESGFGPDPKLPPPEQSLMPTVNIAKAIGWPEGAKPVAAAGTAVNAFAVRLDHPRWLYVLPNGDVLVAETNAPERTEGMSGIKAWAAKKVMKKAGAGTDSANRITLLRDANSDGVAEVRSVFLEGLNSPFGMALIGSHFYVANTDAVIRFPYTPGETKIIKPGTKVTDLPAGPINHHWTKNIIASPDGKLLYVAIGSNSNVAENGMGKETGRADIWEVDLASGRERVFAYGLRNPVGMAWEPESGLLWTVVNERDELGDDLVPDYMTHAPEGGFFGWPYSYFGNHPDERVKPQRPDLAAKAIVPDYALGSHTASLGLAISQGNALPSQFQYGAFIGQHGSWNRRQKTGYKVIFVPFSKGRPSGMPIDVLRGFLSTQGEAYGRPVGVVIDKQGSLLVADDVGNIIWRVAPLPGGRKN